MESVTFFKTNGMFGLWDTWITWHEQYGGIFYIFIIHLFMFESWSPLASIAWEITANLFLLKHQHISVN